MVAGGSAVAMGWQLWPAPARAAQVFPVHFTDAEWKQRLTPQQYAVLRRQSTEYPYTSPLNKEHRKGTFLCAADGHPLFSSTTKFDSGTGWPSFWKPLPGAVLSGSDRDLGYERTEIHCAMCGGHLGHVFNDGPPPTGLRYCMNGVAMRFQPA
ncbi:MAG: peptide-methionine (R)-S-oxide reductase MsrB [Sphingomonadales bacterium]|nr:peptide-methionine (R)-S-oxide reductase MsrB [Sphingomonadales bacterium]MDE2170355.1 peptide-methionine (R)-S-oxide reductase MsrB [Sphingomonadales bacterium]